MLRLINFELRKLIRQRSFYIFILVLVAISLIFAYATQTTYDKADAEFEDGCGLYNMSSAVYSSSIDTVLGIFVAIFVCEDYAGGIVRNIITRGYSRGSIYLAKYIVTLLASVILALITMAAYYVIGEILWGSYDGDINSKLISAFICQLALVAAYATLFYAISSALQKTGGSIAICIMLPVILNLVLPLIDGLLITDPNPDFYYSDYWLSELLSSVSTLTPDTEHLTRGYICAAVYTLVSLALGWISCSKREF